MEKLVPGAIGSVIFVYCGPVCNLLQSNRSYDNKSFVKNVYNASCCP